MTKHIILQKDYTKNPNGYQLKLPLNLESEVKSLFPLLGGTSRR